jgi:hypothetical protein
MLIALASCSKPKPQPAPAAGGPSQTAAASSVSVVGAAASAGAAPSPWAHTPVDPSTIKAPPLTPPPQAKAGPAGVYSQVLEPGEGDLARPVDTIIANFSMWSGDGKLAQSSYAQPQATAFSLASVSPGLREMLAPLKQGAKVRYWLPRASLAGWRPPDWPDADLIIEVSVLSLTHITITNAGGATIDPVPFQPPDAAGPPAQALSTASGLHYIYLAHGTAEKHPKPGEHLKLRIDAYSIDGLTLQQLERGLDTATTLERAPGNLSEILSQLNDGDRVRIWLPMGVGRQVIPKAGSHDVVMDTTLSLQD